VWTEVLAAVRWLAGPAPTVREAWRACAAATGAPLHIEGPLPRPIAALYKACLGMEQVMLFAALSEPGVAELPLAELGDGVAFLEWMERDGWLVGQRQVCAGPPSMIRELYTALATAGGDASPPRGWPQFDVDAHVVEIASLVALALGAPTTERRRLEAVAPPCGDRPT
jgi:hypothetical protein